MRYRLLANYRGAPYEAGVGPQETGVVLFAACPPPEDLGFEPATGHWRKEVGRDDVQTLYESRPVGIFRGERCVVLDDLNDRLHIAYLGHDAFRAEQLGYWEVDRGVFELITPRQEVTEIIEQRLPMAAPGDSAGRHQAGSGPRTQSLPDPLAGPAITTGRTSQRTADEHPLPLEAQAMRAARKAKNAPSEPTARLSEPPAGLSEPSGPVPSAPDGPSSVPSWSPQAVTPQHAPQPEGSGPRPAQASQSLPADAPAAAPVVSGGLVPGVSPSVTAASAAGQSDAAGSPAAPFIGSAPVPQPGPQLPAAGGQVNGTHHSSQPDAPVLGPGPGLLRDQFERPVSARAGSAHPAAGPRSADNTPQAARSPITGAPASGHAPAAAAAVIEAAGAPGATGVGVAVAEPVQGMPYAPVVMPSARPAAPAAERPSQRAESAESQAMSRRSRASRRRLPTHRIFSELATQAGIPPGAYAINDDVDGAMCLVRTAEGFEVFNSLAGARHEVRVFQDEESAYFYLFGVLAAEAVRTGVLGPTP